MKQQMIQMVLGLLGQALPRLVDELIGPSQSELFGRINELEARVAKLEAKRSRKSGDDNQADEG